jgi:hypothetical protein
MMSEGRNRLGDEASPYLKAHASNPVDWYAWGPEALAEAQAQNKPVLLSIGYSACHWCHVMAHESFEDEAIAALMNEHFINIKVDREERPDLDKVYQLAHQILTQQAGGWPLTMFLDGTTLIPFFSGTYFPKKPRYQLPGFNDLLLRIAHAHTEQRDELNEQTGKLAELLSTLNATSAEPQQLEDLALLDGAREALASQYDEQHGGFGPPPKFPMPMSTARLLRQWAFRARAGDHDRLGLQMVMTTLTRIARGGIFDHLGGGFCRYATDSQWMIPHFEKMLYDNGSLLSLYADTLAVGPDLLFEQAVRETAGWLMREMQDEAGGYYAAQDADSEGEEGKYYLWRREQVRKLLSEDEYLVIETLYGLDKPANFEGRWNLHRYDAWPSVVQRLSLERPDADALLASGRAKMLDARQQRTRPATDNKVLTSWNGLAIKGMARAGQVLGEQSWIDSAEHAADFIRSELWATGRLTASWCNGRAHHPGYLDDYANLIDGLLALLAARWRDSDFEWLRELIDATLEHFYDDKAGGFFFTAHDHEQLIYRPKPTTDDAVPPGNGTMARTLIQLGHLFGESRFLDTASATLAFTRSSLERHPAAHCTLLDALESFVYEPELVIIRGPLPEATAWLAACRQGFTPWRQSYLIPYDAQAIPSYLPALVSTETRNRTTAFVCRGLSCSLPIETLDDLKTAIE